MEGKRQKEFWLEPSTSEDSLPDDELQRLNAFKPDALLLSKSALKGQTEIIVSDDPERVTALKDSGVPVALEVIVRNKQDHRKVLEATKVKPDYLIVECPDWRVIPLENLIAENSGEMRLLVRSRNYEESRTALEALEVGVDGVVLRSDNSDEIRKTRALVSEASDSEVNLSTAKVESVRPIRTGARVCVDTTELIRPDEGLLVGCSSQGLFLVEAEVHTNPHVNPRPFRVNAGPVSMYVLTQEAKTRYLSDLQAGETVLIVGKNGRSRIVDVARVKVERRPLILVEAKSGSKTVKTILQNAETVRLLGPNGSIPVHTLKPGDEVYVRLEEGGRHFGSLVEDEMIIER